MSTHIKFTDDQLAAANRVSIVDLMRRSGYRLKREGSEYAWESPTGKVTIRGNQRYHQYEKVGEKAIGFLVRFHEMEFVDAVKFLLSEQGLSVPEEGREEATLKHLHTLTRNLGITMEKALEIIEVPKAEWEKYLKQDS